MKKLFGLLILPLLLLATLATPVLAASLGISPSYTELEVSGTENTTANFQVYYFTGDLQISLVDIPLRVEPETIYVEALNEPVDIQLTIYGDESLGSQVYDGYVRFLGSTGGSVAVAVKVKAKVTNVVEGQPIPQETVPESASIISGLLGFEWYVYTMIGLSIVGTVLAIVGIKRVKARK